MSIFADKAKAADTLVCRLRRVPVLADSCECDPDEAWGKLAAAEREVSRRLGILLEPTWVFAEGVAPEQIAARTPQLPYVVDPGYDYKPEAFSGDGWGHMILRRRPVIEVTHFAFVYQPGLEVYAVPLSWLRVDKKFAHVRLVPSGQLATIPLNAYLLSIIGGGRTIPHLIRATYRAGIEDIHTQYPDLVEFIYRVAALNYIRDTFPGTSESISADGLSESRGFDLAKYTDKASGTIEQEFRNWKSLFNGVMCVVA